MSGWKRDVAAIILASLAVAGTVALAAGAAVGWAVLVERNADNAAGDEL